MSKLCCVSQRDRLVRYAKHTNNIGKIFTFWSYIVNSVLLSNISLLNSPMNRLLQKSPFHTLHRMSGGIVEKTIRNKLQSELNTKHLEVINESHMHNVPKGAETHFKVVVITDKFEGVPLIKRHRLVNDILKEEFQGGVHAISIVAKTPQQWDSSDQVVESSPNCRGGFGK